MAVLSFAPIQFISSTPLATRVFTAATLVFTALYYFLYYSANETFVAPYLVLLPGSKRLWGAVETAKFVVVTITVSNIIAFVVNWLEYMVLGFPVFLYGQAYHGQMALQVGILVAFTQIIPEHQVQVMGCLKHGPFQWHT
ncbi:uncharacterized protein BXZ73DRAFT_96720 [Epithele typhae]|uniref:uncharacterized protein n=1 Tax=Epithele typhae TaxID=378194 RepID=UPI00200747DC|nr:uncharacterized protein BXZ73DRAFT_96720 [Epithele typhae]KAH9944231.1 hypothetical protein BXZ73DRAFT_96720 [Epithele typhae]